MNKNKILSLFFAANMAFVSSGCALLDELEPQTAPASEASAKESTAQTKTSISEQTKEQEDSSKGERVTLHHVGRDDETKASSQSSEETKPSDSDNTESKAQKYLKLLSLSPDEAVSYFGVTVEENYTSEDFTEFMDNLYIDYLPTNWMDMKQYTDDPASLGLDVSEIEYNVGIYAEQDGEAEEGKKTNLKDLEEMLSFPYDKLTKRQQLLYDNMYYNYILSLWSYDIQYFSNPLAFGGGVIQNLAISFYEFEFKNEEDVIIYDKTLANLNYIFDELKTAISQDEAKGYFADDSQIESTISSLEGLCEKTDNPFIDAYNEKIDALSLDKDKADEYKKNNEDLYFSEIAPEMEKFKTYLEDLKGKNKFDGNPLCKYEGGLEYYEYLLEMYTGTQMDADATFDYLCQKIQEYYKDEIREYTLNYSECDKYFSGDMKLSALEGKSAEELIAYAIEELSDIFPSLKYDSYNATALPESLEIDYVLAYYLLPIKNLSENVIRYNNTAREETGEMDFFNTLIHEGYPGHMLEYQYYLANNKDNLNKASSFLGTSEGWATYASRFAYDILGFGSGLANVLRDDVSMSYCFYGIADIAYNAKGWSAKELNNYLEKDLGIQLGESYCATIREAVTSDPGSYLSYAVGLCKTEDIIREYIQEGHTMAQAHEDYINVGVAPFEIMKKYLGKDF